MTLPPRFRKVLGDVVENPVSTALSVVAMAVGVFGLGMILTAWSILARELPKAYLATRPATAVLLLESMDDATAGAARQAPGVRDAEARPEISGRIRAKDGDWSPLFVLVVQDFRDVRIDRITPHAGAWPPADDEILLERTALSVAGAAIGDRVTVRTTDGERSVRIAGTVHAPGLPPAWMEHSVFGFVGWTSVLRGPEAERERLRLVTATDTLDETRIRADARRAADWLAARGTKVSRIDVPKPAKHPHAAQMETFLFLLGAFGALALVLGALLVANMVHALLARQVRQVGVMKAIGASATQIASIYLVHVALLAGVAILIGMPLGIWAGLGYVRFSANMLNMDMSSLVLPAGIVALQIAVGMIVPLAASLVPVVSASRISIHRALASDAGPVLRAPGWIDRALARIGWLPRPLLLTLRTAFQRRARLALTVGTLAAGGAAFMAALNGSGAWTHAIELDSLTRHYDIDLRLTGKEDIASVARVIATVPDVVHAEYWSETGASVLGANGEETTRTALTGIDTGTELLSPRLREGRWLTPADTDAIVINQALLKKDPSLHVGSRLKLRSRDRTFEGPIVGIANELFPVPIAYAPNPAVRPLAGLAEGTTRGARLVTRHHDADGQAEVARALDAAFERAGIDVDGVHALSVRRKALEDHLVIVLSALVLAAALVVLVGAIGLTSTLSLGVIERTREIGILGAIGASPRLIGRDVVVEGIVIGVLSWCVALVVSVPLTLLVGAVAGNMFFRSPLGLFLSPGAAGAWLVLVVMLASAASALPAWKAARLEVREALAHA